MNERIKQLIQDNIHTGEKLLSEENTNAIEQIASKIIDAFRSGKKVVAFGNGGSASDAQHLVAELVCRFEKNRKALPAIALNTNTSLLTAIGNDYYFKDIFSRQIEALVNKGDIVIGISTSGKSADVLEAIEQAKKQDAVTIGFTGILGATFKEKTDLSFCAPSTVTARIQESHILAIHIICSLVEEALFA